MATKEEVKTAAREFLEAVAEAAKTELGPHPTRVQRSIWMVKTAPGSSEGKYSERTVFDSEKVSWLYHTKSYEGFSQQETLSAVLAGAGIAADQVDYWFLQRLVSQWLALPDPFALEDAAFSSLLEQFAEEAVDKTVVVASKDAVVHLHLDSGPLLLDEGVSLRPITEEELWSFGEPWVPAFWSASETPPNVPPSKEWKILNVKARGQELEAYVGALIARDAVLKCLQLASSGCFRIIPLGQEASYVSRVLRRSRPGEGEWQELGKGSAYVLGTEAMQRVKAAWPRLGQLAMMRDDYLRLPADRLAEGGKRDRVHDAIIDYAIGLEALLTEGIRDELKYRFALRGATVLAWDGMSRKGHFTQLQKFYDVRSRIIHGGQVKYADLASMRTVGEDSLRKAWWWFFERNTATLREATQVIDDRVLESQTPQGE